MYSINRFNFTRTRHTSAIIEELSDLQNLESFDTSQVTDMESMFEGCTSLSFLNISKFNTKKVQYMKKMFYNCHNLKSLYFHSISSNSLGTMYQMFYNCAGLEYLDIYSLTENSQSIIEMFEGVNPNLEFCIKENEDMPNIFNMLLEFLKQKEIVQLIVIMKEKDQKYQVKNYVVKMLNLKIIVMKNVQVELW